MDGTSYVRYILDGVLFYPWACRHRHETNAKHFERNELHLETGERGITGYEGAGKTLIYFKYLRIGEHSLSNSMPLSENLSENSPMFSLDH